MRIATWNVNGLRARLEFVLHWLASRQPDLVALQELKLTDEQFPHRAIEAAGYRALTHGQKSWNGVAILSRHAAEVTRKGLPGQEEAGARMLAARAGELELVSIYCPNGKSVEHPDFSSKLEWLDALQRCLTDRYSKQQPLVLAGDFNICPAALDSWNEEVLRGQIFHTQEERSRFRRLLDWGLVDIFRQLHPETQAFTWWDYRAGAFHKRQGLRIDFLLATQEVAARVRTVEIDREYRKKKEGLTASDHAPVLAELE